MVTSGDRFEDAPGGRRPTPVQLALIAAAVLLLLLLLWVFVLGGDDDVVEETAAPPPAPAASTPAEEEVESPGRSAPVETFEVFAPKDPFDPLISAATGGGGAGATTGQTTDGTAGTTADGTATTTTTTADGSTTTTTTSGSGGGGEEVGGHRVRVVDVFVQGGDRRAQVQVDGTVYTVDEGERFAENFQLVSTSGQCATMLFGDDEFTLCEGEEILK